MSEPTPHSSHWLDKLVELVGQDKAEQAVALADRVRSGVASALREAVETIDPAADQRVELENVKTRVAELEAVDTEQRAKIEELEKALDEAEATVLRRGNEINLLNDTINSLKAAPAEAPTGRAAARTPGA